MNDQIYPSGVTIRLAIVEDHDLFRDGLRAALPANLYDVVGEAGDARAGLKMVSSTRPDVLVLDIVLPGAGGIGLLKNVLQAHPTCRTIMLTMHNVESYASQAFDAGARGYALKDQRAEEVVFGISEVAAGRSYLDPRLPRWLLERRTRKEFLGGGGAAHLDELSSREREVFDLIIRGFTNDRVARELCISVKTVETHRARINRKLRVRSPGELMRFAALQGLIGHGG